MNYVCRSVRSSGGILSSVAAMRHCQCDHKLHPLNEQIVKISATDIELAVKLEVLVSEKASKWQRHLLCRRILICTDI